MRTKAERLTAPRVAPDILRDDRTYLLLAAAFGLGLVVALIAARANGIVFVLLALLTLATAYYGKVRQERAERIRAASKSEFVQHLALVNDAIEAMARTFERTDAIERLCQTAQTIGSADGALLYLYGGTDAIPELVYAAGLSAASRQLYTDSVSSVVRQTTRILQDSSGDSGDTHLRELVARAGIRALVEIPLGATAAARGLLVLHYSAPHTPSAGELELLHLLARQISTLIDNTALISALESYAFEMGQLANLSRASTLTLDVNRVVADVADMLSQVMMVSRATVVLVSPQDGSLSITATYTSPERDPIPSTPAQVGFPELTALVAEGSASGHAFHAGETDVSSELNALMRANQEATIAVVPLCINRSVVGAFVLGNHEPRHFAEREWQLVEMAANQVSAHIQNTRLYATSQEALAQRLDELSLIENIARHISSTLDFEQIVRNMLEAAVNSTQGSYASLVLLPDSASVRAIINEYRDGEFSRRFLDSVSEGSLHAQVAQAGAPVIVADAPPGTRYRSAVGVPLEQDNLIIGMMTVESDRPKTFSQEHVAFLINLAGHAVISINNARMLDERKSQVKVLTALQGLALRLSSAVDTPSVSSAILDTTLQLFDGCEEVAIFRHHSQTDLFLPLASLYSDGLMVRASRIPTVVAVEAAETGELQIIQWGNEPIAGISRYATLIGIPLKRGSRVNDVLCIAFAQPHNMRLRDLDTLTLLASQAAGHLENAALHEQILDASERMAAILNSTRDAVILLDHKGSVVEANPAARRMLGEGLRDYAHEVGMSLLEQVDTDTIEIEQPWRDSSETQETDRLTRRQLEWETATGIRYLEEIGTPVVSERGRTVGWLLSLRDMTEEKEVEAYRDDITAMVVHDLRGPLASIISSIYLSLEDLQDHAELNMTSTMLQLSADSANGLMRLVDSLLDIARMEAREMPLQVETIALEPMVEQAVRTLSATLTQSRITVQREFPPDLLPVQVDGVLVERVILNLMDNAIRHTPQGKTIYVGAQCVDRNMILVRVADSGHGIPEEDRERVFEMFKQSKGSVPSVAKRGTGLGLTFCRLAIEAHGGRIWIENTSPLSGASFAFTLPAADVPRQAHGLQLGD